ncbi:MAG: hypothetical protein WD739_11890 [Actinomycetota bacterium]
MPVIHFGDLTGRKRKVEDAAARKRLLQARYLAWAVTLHILGPAGERATHASLLKAAPIAGYRVERPEGGPIGSLFGKKVVGGPLDDAVHLQLKNELGVPTGVVSVPIEVKNVREWIYPGSERLHQLLHKAAALQDANPELPIVPVLVCRRAPWATFRMAKAFGFYVADAKAQFLPEREDVSQTHVEEMRVELGYSDLVIDTGRNRLLDKHFGKALPGIAEDAASSWAIFGPRYLETFEALRQPTLSEARRSELTLELESEGRRILRDRQGDEDEDEVD